MNDNLVPFFLGLIFLFKVYSQDCIDKAKRSLTTTATNILELDSELFINKNQNVLLGVLVEREDGAKYFALTPQVGRGHEYLIDKISKKDTDRESIKLTRENMKEVLFMLENKIEPSVDEISSASKKKTTILWAGEIKFDRSSSDSPKISEANNYSTYFLNDKNNGELKNKYEVSNNPIQELQNFLEKNYPNSMDNNVKLSLFNKKNPHFDKNHQYYSALERRIHDKIAAFKQTLNFIKKNNGLSANEKKEYELLFEKHFNAYKEEFKNTIRYFEKIYSESHYGTKYFEEIITKINEFIYSVESKEEITYPSAVKVLDQISLLIKERPVPIKIVTGQ